MEDQRLGCVYCGNPRPSVLKEVQDGTTTKQSLTAGLSGGFSFLLKLKGELKGSFARNKQKHQIINPTPLVDCGICGRKYYLYGIKSDKEFINEFLENHVDLTENVIDMINLLGIPLEHLGDYVVGITKPERSRSQLHIVIFYSNRRYFITCEKFRGGYLALNVERVVIE